MTWREIVVEFGDFALDRPDAELRFQGVPVDPRLDTQELDFLALLLSRNGMLATHAEITTELWPQGIRGGNGKRRRADAENVHRVKRDVVEILSRHEFDDSWIQTRYGVGYVASFPPPAAPPRRRIAILPFTCADAAAGPDLAHDVLVALVSRAARAPLLAPIASSAVVALQRAGRLPNEIARAVQADFVLVGSIAVDGELVCLEVELLGRSGRVVERIEARSPTVEEAAADLLRRVERLVTAADALDDDGPGNRDIAERYAIAADYYRQRDFVGLVAARRLLESVVVEDPEFLGARALLADVTLLLGSTGYMELDPATAFARARDLVDSVLAVDPDNAAAIATSGLIAFIHDWDFARAERLFEQACRIDPGDSRSRHWNAHLLLVTGRASSALEEIEAAKDAAPTNPLVYGSVGWLRLMAGHVQEAVHWGAEATARFEDFAPGRLMYGLALECGGRYRDAEAEYVAARDIALGPPRQSLGHALVPLAALGHLYATTRRRDLAAEILESVAESARRMHISSYCRALVLTGLGEYDAALDALEAAAAERCDWLVHLEVDPRWKPLSRRKRFRLIVGQVGVGGPSPPVSGVGKQP